MGAGRALAASPVPCLPQVAALKALRVRRAAGLDRSGLLPVEPSLRARCAVWLYLAPAPGAQSTLSLELEAQGSMLLRKALRSLSPLLCSAAGG